ncbi:AAA family ATPase [Lujinxingia vulgaris]|uniref:AAA family ATPase n=1 Tax=Lujinxingia vulgaris TaxID=2600176 RepID=A0A5C6X8M0_9DELT|nr:AAA family ATPase [Lujinxingia vulgaris]TXD37688.1 AAA family ATPase [Lujinxingia vulgaris]
MKLHRLKIENLNSFYGTHELRFDPDLRGVPLFLIHGPTGSGKTTLLDAICLALFGCTPRLNAQKKGDEDRKNHHIMSSGTGECSAELTFSRRNGSGVREYFRATWSLRRAHGNPDGNIQNDQRKIEALSHPDDPDPRILADDNRAKYYGPAFDEVLGAMQLDDFLRTVILPQGKFAEFLHGDEKAKAGLLKQLTDVSEFKEIGEACAQRHSQAKKAVEKLTIELNAQDLLSAEERQALTEKLEEATAAETLATSARNAAREMFQWQKSVDALEHEQQVHQKRASDAAIALQEHALELDRLALSETVEPARETLRDLNTLDADIKTRQVKLAELREQRPELEEAVELHQETLLTRQKVRDAADQALKDNAEPLKAARRLDTQIASLTRDVGAERTALDTAKQNLNETKKLTTKEAQALDALNAEQKRLEADQPTAPWSDELSDAIVAMRPQVVALQSERDANNEGTHKGLTLKKSLTEQTQNAEKFKQSIKNYEKEHEDLSKEFESRQKALKEILGDKPDASEARRAWTAAISRLENHSRTFRQAAERTTELVELSARVKDAESRRDALKQTLNEAVENAQNAGALVEKKEHARKLAEEQKVLAERLFGLIDARGLLKYEEPCPVCGSTTHPYAGSDLGHEELRDGQERALELLRGIEEELEAARQASTAAASTQSRVKAETDAADTGVQELNERLQREVTSLRALVADALDAPLADAPDWSALTQDFNTRSETLQTEAQTLLKRLDALDVADKALIDAREKLNQADAKLAELRPKLERATDEVARCTEEITALREKVAEDRRKLRVRLEALSEQLHTLDRPLDTQAGDDRGTIVDALDRHITSLEEERALRAQLKARLEDLKGRRSNIEKDLATLEARHKSESENVEERAQALQARESELGELRKERQGIFEGQSADEVEKRLQKQVSASLEAYETARKNLESVQEKLKNLNQDIKSHTKELDDAATKRQTARQSLEDLLETLPVDTLEALRAALLGVEERERLMTLRDTLRQEKATAEELLKKSENALKQLQDTRPEGLDEVRDLEALEARLESCEADLRDATARVATLKERLNADDQKREDLAEGRKRLEALNRTLGHWKTIHDLIGINGGTTFENHALSFHLQNIAVYANHHLQDLAPRYALQIRRDEQGLPKLDFEILDRNRANSVRPVTTLSGGESFLLSLALAMALADLRQVHMPLETLLLDEGFGTLDQESLQVAIGVLNSLQSRSNRQIGLISHVEGLKESVEYRVRVTPEGNGRSSLRIERPDAGLVG